MGAIPMIVSAIANGANVRVVWGNFQTASTDGARINMPLLPLEDEDVETYALGYAVHETGHIVGTDFNVPRKPGLATSLAGILEDVRIEAERMRTLPGARRWLEKLAYALLRDGKLGNAAPDLSMPNKLVSYMLTHLWVEILGFRGLSEAAAKCRANLAASLPPDVFQELEDTALRVRHAKDTAEVVDLADQLMAVLREKQEEYEQKAQQEQPQPHPEPDQQDESPQGCTTEEGSDEVDDGEEQGQSVSADQQDQDQQDQDQGQKDDGDGEANGESRPDAPAPDESPAPNAGAEADSDSAQDNAGAAGEQRPEPEQGDGGGEQAEAGGDDAGADQGGNAPENASGADEPSESSPDADSVPGQAADGDAGGESEGAGDRYVAGQQGEPRMPDPGEVAQTLADLVNADEAEEGKDISERIAEGLSQSLAEAQLTGNGQFSAAPDVHDLTGILGAPGSIQEVRTQSTAIRARLDEYVAVQTRARRSTSRAGQHLARDAGLRLALRDYRVYDVVKSQARKVDTAFMLMVDCSISMRGLSMQVARQSALALAVALEQIAGVQLAVSAFGGPFGTVTRVKRFGEDLRRTAGRFNQLDASGSTPMAEGLLVAHTDLLGIEAERRIAVIVTDGEPNDANATAQVTALGEKLGIEHLGIGIGAGAQPARFFKLSRNIQDVSELPSALIGMVQDRLFDNRLAA